jgi:hypothetical protein
MCKLQGGALPERITRSTYFAIAGTTPKIPEYSPKKNYNF